MILLIDNYDSFTYNLYQYLGKYSEVAVRRNDEITLEEILHMKPSHIVLSPGPGRPDDAGICIPLIQALGSSIPILGVCLGHQCIGQAYGGKIDYAEVVFHGKTSPIEHYRKELFDGLESPLQVARYHSLVIDKATLPDVLQVIAASDDDEIMAIKHKQYPVIGIQFHPESIMTDGGEEILKNFMKHMKGEGR